MKLKKKLNYRVINYKIKLILCIVFIIIASSLFLLAIPTAINLAQDKVFVLAETKLESHNVAPQVVAVQRAPVLRIIDLGKLPPKFSAQGVLAEDLDSGQIIYQKNADLALSPASTTKLLTALVALEHYKSDDVLQVYQEDMVGGSSMGLNVNERLTFRSLLYGMLLNSGNDAAFTVASNYPGGLAMFVLQMNKKAQSLGLTNSHFENPAGFDGPNHYSSASDLSKIAFAVANDLELRRVVSTKETSVMSFDNSRTYSLKNLNKLLGQTGILGIKTGFTEKSGENLVGLVERNNHKVLTVVLDSKDRFGETSELIDWVYSNFEWKFE